MNTLLDFLGKFLGRYTKLARLDVVGRQLMRIEVAMAGLAVMLGMSFWPQSPIRRAMMNAGASPSEAKAHMELAKEAAKVYDYELAEEEYQLSNQLINQSSNQQIKGARDEVFPEEVIKAEIGKWEKTAETVNSRDVWLKLAGWYWQIFDEEKARNYWEKAWLVDPNNKQVQETEKLFF